MFQGRPESCGLGGHVSSTFWNNDNVRYPSIHVRIIGGVEKWTLKSVLSVDTFFVTTRIIRHS
jgi:hypothetical protein